MLIKRLLPHRYMTEAHKSALYRVEKKRIIFFYLQTSHWFFYDLIVDTVNRTIHFFIVAAHHRDKCNMQQTTLFFFNSSNMQISQECLTIAFNSVSNGNCHANLNAGVLWMVAVTQNDSQTNI